MSDILGFCAKCSGRQRRPEGDRKAVPAEVTRNERRGTFRERRRVREQARTVLVYRTLQQPGSSPPAPKQAGVTKGNPCVAEEAASICPGRRAGLGLAFCHPLPSLLGARTAASLLGGRPCASEGGF